MTSGRYRENDEVADAIARLIGALGRRIADGDPDELKLLLWLAGDVEKALADAVAGIRRAGASDSAIARELGVSKQAVQQRWPRRDQLAS